jgi:RND family efflux transporter MFP subunit
MLKERRTHHGLRRPCRRPCPRSNQPRTFVPWPILWFVTLAIAGCASEDIDLEPVIRPVLVQPAAAASAVHERTFPARAQAGMESVLSFKVGGQLREIAVEVGETVRLGQRIAVLDDRDLRLELKQAEAGYAQASAQDRNARSAYGRTKLLHERDAASDNKLDSDQSAAMSARANLEAQAQAVALAKAHLGYAELVAPADGLIAIVDVNSNENVTAGQSIVTLNSGGRAEVAFTVPENLIGSIERGQPATVRIAALDEEVFPAEIVEVGVGSGRSAFPVTARLLDSNDRIRSGMVAEVSVRFTRQTSSDGQATIVPAFSVAEDAEGRFVYIAIPTAEGLATVERRTVEIGPLSAEGLEIKSGLELGDQIVIAGLRFVEPGMTVRMMAP